MSTFIERWHLKRLISASHQLITLQTQHRQMFLHLDQLVYYSARVQIPNQVRQLQRVRLCLLGDQSRMAVLWKLQKTRAKVQIKPGMANAAMFGGWDGFV